MKISYYIILSMALIISSCSEQGRIPIYGCTDPNATNFDPDSNIDDESCEVPIYGCTDSTAINFDLYATIDDESCVYILINGCTDSTAINFDLDATIDDGSCEYYSFNNIYQIFDDSGCFGCHMDDPSNGLDLSTYEGVFDGGILDLSNPSESVIFTTFDSGGLMNSYYGTDYSLSNEELVLEWILQGAPE